MSINIVQALPTLTKLATVQKNKQWIQADLTLRGSSLIGRICWCVIKHFDCLREFFYGVNLGKSKARLHTLRAAIMTGGDQKQIAIYNSAVKAFNIVAKRHQALEIKPADIVSANKMLDVSERIKVGTYNILFPQPAVPDAFSTEVGYSLDAKGNLYENSDDRIKIIEKNLLAADLDVFCLQEVVEKTFDHLSKALEKSSTPYECAWVPHSRRSDAHGVAIFYKKHRFDQLGKSEHFNLYTIPDSANPGKTFNKPRKELIMDLQDKTSQKVFRVVSCHLLDPRDFKDKGMHVRKVVVAADQPAPYYVHRKLILGDMNQDEWGDFGTPKPPTPCEKHAAAFQPLVQKYFVDGNYATTEVGKALFDNGPLFFKKRHIDWIWSSHYKPEPLALPGFDIHGSDHLLVASTIR